MADKTMSDWIVALRKVDANLANALHTEKLKDYQRLKESGLPIFDDFSLPFSEFSKDNDKLTDFLSRYNGFTIRALPNKEGLERGLTRKYKICVKSYEECQSFLEENIKAGDETLYSILLTDWSPTKSAGIVISSGLELIIEMAEGDVLPQYSHDELIPDAVGEFSGFIRRMRYFNPKRRNDINEPPVEKRELMWSILQYLRRDTDEVAFLQGYFEFVVTDKGPKFVEYKVNEQYLKIPMLSCTK